MPLWWVMTDRPAHDLAPIDKIKTHRTFHLCGIPLVPLFSDRQFACQVCGYHVVLRELGLIATLTISSSIPSREL